MLIAVVVVVVMEVVGDGRSDLMKVFQILLLLDVTQIERKSRVDEEDGTSDDLSQEIIGARGDGVVGTADREEVVHHTNNAENRDDAELCVVCCVMLC